MPKITKLRLHVLKLCKKTLASFFSGHGVYLRSGTIDTDKSCENNRARRLARERLGCLYGNGGSPSGPLERLLF